MKNETTIYHLIVDKSGSMMGSEESVIEGFNGQLEQIKKLKEQFPEQTFLMGLTFFNHHVINQIMAENIHSIEPISRNSYRPEGSTALLDAIGKSVYEIKSGFGKMIDEDKATVVVVIITDGYENASRFYTYHDIAKLIPELEETEKWMFNFLGADMDAIHTSKMLNIQQENTISFSKEDYKSTIDICSESLGKYFSSKQEGKKISGIFNNVLNKDLRRKK